MTCVMTRGQPSYLSSSCTLVETEFLVQACINRLAVLQDLKNFLASASHHTAETQRLQVGAYYCMEWVWGVQTLVTRLNSKYFAH